MQRIYMSRAQDGSILMVRERMGDNGTCSTGIERHALVREIAGALLHLALSLIHTLDCTNMKMLSLSFII